MIRGVAGRRHRDDVAGFRQVTADGKGAGRFGRQMQRFWGEPCRPSLRKITAYPAEHSPRGLQFAWCDEDFGVRKMREAAVMVHMQMGEDHPLHIARSDAERAQLRTDLLFALDAKRHFPADIRVKRLTGFQQMRALPAAYHDDTFALTADPALRRQPAAP